MAKLNKLFFLLAVLCMVMLPNALAKKGHIKLLAVRETENGTYEGGIADLYLEIREGSGRVFLETFPLTKTDTQMSTRFGKTIACDFVGEDCSDTDFFYTITADSPIIAGPSAGSSIAGLTASMLMGKEIDESVAATGTINSGGLVGPVGGLKAKLEAAAKAGINKALIPAGENIGREENETISREEFEKEIGIKIVEVSTIEDVVQELTGIKKKKQVSNIDINKEYSLKMKNLAMQLCNRSQQLSMELENKTFALNLSNLNLFNLNLTMVRKEVQNLTDRSKESFDKNEFYSSASYCFGSNVQLSTVLFSSENLSSNNIIEKINGLKKSINEFDLKIENMEKKTITDLETYMLVKERLDEAEELVQISLSSLNESNSSMVSAVRNLAYASERYNSALSWATFFGTEGKQFNLNKELIKDSCKNKLSEVEERIQYVELYFPDALESVKKDVSRAYSDLSSGKYELCLFAASKAKAEVDTALSIFGVDPDHFEKLLERKLRIVKENLADQTANGIFPIIGYSYYEYANSLKSSNPVSGLIYSEYALELGNLDIYFKTKKPEELSSKIRKKIDTKLLKIFLLGTLAGFLAGLLVKIRKRRNKLEIRIKDK